MSPTPHIVTSPVLKLVERETAVVNVLRGGLNCGLRKKRIYAPVKEAAFRAVYCLAAKKRT